MRTFLHATREGDMRRKLASARRAMTASFGFAVWSAIMVAGSPALAEILQFSAVGLERRCPCGGDGAADEAEEFRGVLQPKNVNVRYFMPVALPDGQQVCSFSMIYHDINAADEIVATLRRKRFVVDSSPFNLTNTMASVTSAAGTPDTVRKATDSTIAASVINTNNAFYYIQVDVPTTNLNLLGFQIDVRDACPG